MSSGGSYVKMHRIEDKALGFLLSHPSPISVPPYHNTYLSGKFNTAACIWHGLLN